MDHSLSSSVHRSPDATLSKPSASKNSASPSTTKRTQQKKKILHFLPENLTWGGIEVYLHTTLSTLKNHPAYGEQYDLVAVVTTGGRLATRLKESGIRVRELPLQADTRLARQLDLRVLKALLGILKEEKPDLVHIHKGRLEQAVIKLAGYPLVMTYHSYGGPNNLENAPNLLKRTLYSLTTPLLRGLTPFLDAMLVVSNYERQRLYREGFIPESFKAEVLYNGIPTTDMLARVKGLDITHVRQALNIPIDAKVVSFICRLAPDKNALAFLSIAEQVLAKRTDTKSPVWFVVAGQGPDEAVFKAAFEPGGTLYGHGQYLGFCSEVPKLIMASDLTVSTSCQEGFGLRVLESLLLGRPCLTYAAGGIPEVMSLPEAKDWLVPVGNQPVFIQRLLHMLNQPPEVMEQLKPKLKAHALSFDVIPHVGQLCQVYQQILFTPM
jgi:glycosyltransferase involved in cell wall biosynthesis